MSNIEKPSSTDVAIPEDLRGVGTEDADGTDLQTPRLKIDHNNGLFELFEEKFPSFDAILLGMLKQRVLWQPQLEANARPICRSWDFKTGRPDSDRWSTEYMRVSPADESGLGPVIEGEELPCKDCLLKEFGTDPKGTRAPWCSEQHVYPLLMLRDGGYQPAILTLQKTGIKPSRNYLQPFLVSKHPLFIVTTGVSLDLNKKGVNTYSTVRFTRGEETDSAQWRAWAEQWRTIKSFLQTPRDFTAADDGEETTVAAPSRREATPPSASETESLWDEDDA